MSNLTLPERYKHLEEVDNLDSSWDSVKLAIRPECRDESSIEKAKIAMSVGLNDAAINYFWNLTIYDIQRKVIAYGIEYFPSAINWGGKPLKTLEDLREVKDYQLITGAFALGVIPEEADFFLQHCREIRNKFSAAHFPLGDVDKFETINFIKNCIKYVLTYDPPAPGLQIKDLIENLTIERLDSTEELEYIVAAQSPKIQGPILHSLFASFIKQDCDPTLKYNIKKLAPIIWELVSDDVKSSIAGKFASLRDVKGKDAANEALAFLKVVDGVSFVPESFREIIFKKQAQFLIDAHFGWNNFYAEPEQAVALSQLGSDVPISALSTYVKAVICSFIGNIYGFARDAQSYNEKMLTGLSQTGVRAVFNMLEKDIDIVRELTSMRPAKRLKELMEVIREKTMLPKQKEMFEFIGENAPEKISNHFKSLYNKMAK
ncbi:MAG: hypothetical protein FWE28_06390 [Oscillospiraceae bacterium]|nr:hypothetical protein [Oscillospiraceae bacterium]